MRGIGASGVWPSRRGSLVAFGIAFGIFLSFGGPIQAAASIVFGPRFVACLLFAYRFIRRGDPRSHRRWMIRAFAVGLAVGTIRIWVGLFQGLQLLSFRDSFGIAFWLSFSMHVIAAEVWLRWRPWPGEGPSMASGIDASIAKAPPTGAS